MKTRKLAKDSSQSPKRSSGETKQQAEPRRSSPVVSETDQTRLLTDPDFVLLRHCDYSLAAVISRYPQGVPHKTIARALGLTEEQVGEILQKSLTKLREHMQ